MKNKTWLTRTLAAALLLVWGCIGYQLIAAFSAVDPSSSGSEGKKVAQTPVRSFVYRADVRDPFSPAHSNAPKDTAYRHRPRIPPTNPPLLRLTGIMAEGRQKMALLEDAGGNLRFVHRGDTICGIKVVTIEATTVRYIFQKQPMEWRLEDGNVQVGTR